MTFSQTGISDAPRCTAVGPRTGIRCTKEPDHVRNPKNAEHEVRTRPSALPRETW